MIQRIDYLQPRSERYTKLAAVNARPCHCSAASVAHVWHRIRVPFRADNAGLS